MSLWDWMNNHGVTLSRAPTVWVGREAAGVYDEADTTGMIKCAAVRENHIAPYLVQKEYSERI